MDITAKSLADWALAQIEALRPRYPHETAMYRELAALADLSVSSIRQFHQGTQPNPSTDTLDRMIFAIKAAQRLHAA